MVLAVDAKQAERERKRVSCRMGRGVGSGDGHGLWHAPVVIAFVRRGWVVRLRR